MVKISVIVPVYNSGRFICRCVDSILRQTFTDFELLLIDDGSTDNSGLICDEYAIIDHRVKVYHKTNGGVSSARNVGLEIATGDWITFIDSDDWIEGEYLETLYSKVETKCDLVISYAKYVGINGEIPQTRYQERSVLSQNQEMLFLNYDLAWQTSPWAKLYKKEICNNLRFKEGVHIGEDLIFLYNYIMKSNVVHIQGDTLYNYDVSNENTLTRRIGTLDDELFAFKNVDKTLSRMISFYNIVNINVLKKIEWIRAYYIHRVLNSLYHTQGLHSNARLEHIARLNIKSYITYMPFVSYKERILRYLLKNKMYRLYDLSRTIVANIKRVSNA